MLRVVTGPFHPDLESALVQELTRFKADDSLAPLAVVVPSSSLRDRTLELLTLDRRLCLLNVHVLTFHQLALHLYEEAIGREDRGGGSEAAAPCLRMELVGDLFFTHLLRLIGTRDLPDLAPLRLGFLPPGGWASLWATIRDLKDAGVDPSAALRAVFEGQFEADEQVKLRGLFTLYAAAVEAGRALAVASPDDLASVVTQVAPRSRFLAGLKRLCYYGFYDLTQVQLSLFETIANLAPATLFFPLGSGAAYSFARRFFERHILPLASSVDMGSDGPGRPAQESVGAAPVRLVMNAVGADDEVTVVCKEIMTLVETHDYCWTDIGVVARTLDPYQAAVRRLFDLHRIPFTTTAGVPLLQAPAAKTILQLASLSLNGFYRAAVLDVLASPFYRLPAEPAKGREPRPDLWRMAVRALGITRGEDEWRRLSAAGAVEAGAECDEVHERGAACARVDVEQLRLLDALVFRLIRDCKALPSEGEFGALSDAFETLLESHVLIAGTAGVAGPSDPSDPGAEPVGATIRRVLDELRQLDHLGSVVTWEDWVVALAAAMERATVPLTPTDHVGVRVLDAMSARGLPFRAVFVLGLNEKVFPRFIHEDAFLRDRDRLVLEKTLGYKMDEKLAGYDEESLLFALLRGAARDRLYVSYQRADAEGRPLAASPFLTGLEPAGGDAEAAAVLCLPRRSSDRWPLPQFVPSLLTREELSLWLIATDRDPTPVLAANDREPALFQNGWQMLRELEGDRHSLGPFDGDTGPLGEFWSRLAARGLAPTPLEQYARCPFQYFGAQVLALESIRDPVGDELPPAEIGRLCHDLLRVASERLIETGWPARELGLQSLRREVEAAAEGVFVQYGAVHGTGHDLLWDLMQETVIGLVIEALAQDQRDYRECGFAPVGFEVEAEGSLEGVIPQELGAIKVKGRLDRVDRRMSPPAVRVVDYKYRVGGKMEDKDRDLVTAAVRGFRLQPPFYALMREGAGGELSRPPERVEFHFLAPNWDPVVQRSGFETTEWKGRAADELRSTVTRLLLGVKAGKFPIVPDRYCDQCAFRTACRRYHGPSWWRAHRAEPARELRFMRKLKVTRNGAASAGE